MEGRCLISERKDRSIILILGKPQTCRSTRSVQISHNTFFPFSFVGTVKKRSGRRREGGGGGGGEGGVGALGVQFIFVRRQQRNCTFNQDFYQFASADGAKTKPIVAVTGWGFKCSNATVRARCAYIPGVPDRTGPEKILRLIVRRISSRYVVRKRGRIRA